MNWLRIKQEAFVALWILFCCTTAAVIFTLFMSWWFR